MANTPFVKKVANFAYENFTKHPGEFLLISGMISWAASCVNQIVAIALNKKIPKEQKYFLVPQEITDGIVNVTLFALFTRSFTRVGERLVETGRLLPKNVRTKLKAFNNELGKPDFDIEKKVPVLEETNSSGFNKTDFHKYKDFHKGIGFIFSTIGAIISCDFVTPFVRNKIASARQKAALEKDKSNQQPSIQPYVPVLPAQNKLDKNDSKLTAINTPHVTTSGSMKV